MMMTVVLIVSIAAFVMLIASLIPTLSVPMWISLLLIIVAVLLMQLPKG